MPMPSKFTAKRRELILVALSVGASRRTAAEVASLDPSTLSKWIAQGERSTPDGRFGRFRAEVLAAEQGKHKPALLPLDEPSSRNVAEAWRFLAQNEWAQEPPSREPVTVRVTYSDGSPLNQGGTR